MKSGDENSRGWEGGLEEHSVSAVVCATIATSDALGRNVNSISGAEKNDGLPKIAAGEEGSDTTATELGEQITNADCVIERNLGLPSQPALSKY